VAAGFAGSVIIGFAMIDELRRLAAYEDERMGCDPLAIEKQWPDQARRIFSEFPNGGPKGTVSSDPHISASKRAQRQSTLAAVIRSRLQIATV
jgi:hypothetical protein